MGPRRLNGIFHHPFFVMGNSFCSVRDNHCCCSVHNGEGSRTSVDQKFDHTLLTEVDIAVATIAPGVHSNMVHLMHYAIGDST
jgi:hypothetical protein